MNPSVSMPMHDGVPYANCPTDGCGKPSRCRMLVVEWTGLGFDIRGTFECRENGNHVHHMRLQDDLGWKKVERSSDGWVEVSP